MYRSKGETCLTECYPDQGYVIKQFRPRKPKFRTEIDPLRDSLELCFYREVTCLERLKHSPRFPKLLDSDPEKLSIKMSWVGYPFRHFAQDQRDTYLQHAEQIVKDLDEADIDVAYQWSPGDDRQGYCLSMMMVDGLNLNLIDFERAWPRGCDREYQFNSLFTESFAHHDNDIFLQHMKREISNIKITQPPEGRYEEK